MKKINLILIVILLISGNIIAQTWENNIIDNSVTNNHIVLTTDINNDGFEDVILHTFNNLIYYPNNGDGTFNAPQLLFEYISNVGGIVTGDFNNDNFIDFIGRERFFNGVDLERKLIFYKQTASGFEKIIIEEDQPFLHNIKTADIDNDNDMDLIVINNISEINLYRNNGDGSFEIPITLANTSEYYGFDINDFNNDGFLDVYTLHANNTNGENTIVLNDTNGGFLEEEILEELNIDGFGGDEFIVGSGDFNNDGFTDVVLYTGGGNSIIKIHMNNGNGLSFTQTQELSSDIGITKILSTDIDLDGDIDIITNYSNLGQIVWFENDGSGTFLPPNIIFSNSSLTSLSHLALADINNDNVLDIILANIFSPLSYLKTSDVLSINDTDIVKLKIYPNPVGSNLKFDSPFNVLQVTIFDITGKKMLKIKSKNILQINLSNLEKGVYNVILDTKNKSFHRLIIKE